MCAKETSDEDHRACAQRSHVKMEVEAGYVQPQPQPQPRATKDDPSTADN